MFTHIIGKCPVSGVQTIERRELVAPNWKEYCDNVKFRRDNPNWNQTIKQNVNQRHNALKTQ